MPFTEKRLAGPTQLTTSAVAIYTVPANRTTIVKQLVATNTSASAATFTLYIGTATAANAVFNATSVAANDSLVINLSQVLSTGEVLRALASANTAINLTISGVENDGPLTPTSTYIADNAITTAKLADASVTSAKIADSSVTSAKLANTAGAVMVFANSTARSTAIPSPTKGMTTYLQDVDELEVYNGSSWLRAVVTADDEAISTSGNITSSAGNISATAGSVSAGTTLSVGTDATISGSLTVDTSTLRVDATNNVVGVGTATPSTGQYNDFGLDVYGRIRVQGGKSGGTSGVALGTAVPNANYYNAAAFMGMESASDSGAVGFWHSGAWRMLVDNQGRKVTPYQPYFNGQNGGGHQAVTGVWNPSTVRVNNGNRYNTGNGIFFPGVAGYVLCAFSSLINTPNSTSHFYTYFMINGVEASHRVHTDYAQPRSYEPVTNVAILKLDYAYDSVSCWVACQDGAAIYASPWGGGLTYALLG